MITNLKDQLKRDEGIAYYPYRDTKGISTVGVGHNLEAHPLPLEQYPMSAARVDEILDIDIARVTAELHKDLPWTETLTDVYKGVLLNMAFNMGITGLLKFVHMLEEIRAAQYQFAANAGIESLWYTQVGNRAVRLMQQLRIGVWQ